MMSVNLMEPSSASSASSSFVWKYCRMCALEVKQGVCIFGEEGRRLQLPEKIRKTVAILALEEDTLPKRICTSCCNSLEAFAQFKDSVVDAQEKLSSIAKSIEKSQDQSLQQLRNKQFIKSPKRPRLSPSSSSVPSHSNSHNIVLPPAPSIVSVDPDLGDPAIECDDLPPSVEYSGDEDNESYNKVQPHPECYPVSGSEAPPQGTANELNNQEPLPGPSHSLAICLNRQTATTSSDTYGSIQPEPLNVSKNSSFSDNSLACTDDEEDDSDSEDDVENSSYLICGLCTAPVSDRNSLVVHHNNVHNSQQQEGPTYGCSACPRISSNYDSMRQHIYRHKVCLKGTFRCVDCEISFATKDHLHFHVTSKHNPAGNKTFSCSTCGKNYGSNVALEAHLRKRHSQNLNRDGMSKLESSLSNEQQPAALLSSTEADQKVPKESEKSCSSLSSSLLSLDNENDSMDAATGTDIRCHHHRIVNASGNTNEPVSRVVVKGPNDSGSVASTDKPSAREENEGHWKCDFCDKILYSKHGYDSHVAVHKGRRFTCEHCGATYTQKITLDHHVKVHHTNLGKEFECSECKKTFKTFRQLSWHRKTHDKPLAGVTCPQCEKTFLNMVSLKTHMKIHTGVKRFSCAECPKSFYSKLKLQDHTNSHTGKRPYGCPVEHCSKVFSCFSNYSKHFKKSHKEKLGQKGKKIPNAINVEDNNNISTAKPSSSLQQKSENNNVIIDKTQTSPSKSYSVMPSHSGAISEKGSASQSVIAISSSVITQGKPLEQSHQQQACATSQPAFVSSSESLSHNSQSHHHPQQSIIHVPYSSTVLPSSVVSISPSSHATKSAHSGMYSTSSSSSSVGMLNPPVIMNSSSVPIIPQVFKHPNIPLMISSNNNTIAHGGQCNVIAVHSSNPSSTNSATTSDNNNLSLAHSQSSIISVPGGLAHPQNQQPVSVNGAIAAHSNAHSTTSTHTQTIGAQSHLHPFNQFQLQQPHPHAQSVWQPVMLPSSKTYNNPTTMTGLATLNGLDLLDCGATIVAAPAHSSDTLSSAGGNHSSHSSQHQQSTFNVIHIPVTAAHHATTMPHSNPSHLHHTHPHHGVTNPPSSSGNGGHQTIHQGNNSNHPNSTPIHIPTPSAHTNNSNTIPLSSAAAGTVNVPNYVPSALQSEPMKLSYKMDSNNFQEMPMELTKVFQRDPLELCVRQEFPPGAGAQPLMDLSSRVVNVTVGGGNQPLANVSSIAMSLNGNSSSSNPAHYANTGHNGGGGGTGSTNTTTVLSVPYHRTDLVERELTLNDFTGAFRQPIDLIARSDEHSHELCTEGNLVDLSLRSSFGQDQSASSFLRELIDLSSRSDSFHGEINLTNKQPHQSPPSASNSNPQLHHQTHSSTGQLLSATKPSNNPPNSHHNHGHHHHHVQNPSHQHHNNHPNNTGGGGVGLQTVIYPDTIFGL